MKKNFSKQLNNNKKFLKTRKRFFILIGGIIIFFILLGVIFLVKNTNSKNKQNPKKPNSETISISEISSEEKISLEDWKNCPYLDEKNLTIQDPKRKYSQLILHETELPQWKKVPQEFIVKCWKKGYHWRDILQLWEWKLSESEIPDLKTPHRIGIINCLSYLLGPPGYILDDVVNKHGGKIPQAEWEKMFEEKWGSVKDLVIIVRKTTGKGKINLDKGIAGASPYGNTRKYTQKLITFILNQEKLNLEQHEIFLLNCIGSEQKDEHRAATSIGKSSGSAIYLALLSALYQKPIAKSIASTGVINTSQKKKSGKITDQEINLIQGSNLPIGGLRGKANAAIEKEINCLVLSTYNNSPNLLGQTYKTDYYVDNQHITEEWGIAEDYSKVVSPEIREKLKIYWTKNISELRNLLFSGKLD